MICLLAISFGVIGACLGAAAVNENYDPRQWDWTSGKTWLGLIEGGVAKGFMSSGFRASFGVFTGIFTSLIASGIVLGGIG